MAGRAISLLLLLDGNVRTTGTHNSVSMATRLAGSDDRVDASVEDRLSTGQAPKRVSRGGKESHGENRKDHHEAGRKANKKESCKSSEPVDAGIYLRVFILLVD